MLENCLSVLNSCLHACRSFCQRRPAGVKRDRDDSFTDLQEEMAAAADSSGGGESQQAARV